MSRGAGISWGISICPYIDIAHLVCPTQQRLEGIVQRRFHHFSSASQHGAVRAVNGDHIANCKLAAIWGRQQVLANLKLKTIGPNNTGQTQTPGNHSRVAAHATALGQDRAGRMHAPNILRTGFAAH